MEQIWEIYLSPAKRGGEVPGLAVDNDHYLDSINNSVKFSIAIPQSTHGDFCLGSVP